MKCIAHTPKPIATAPVTNHILWVETDVDELTRSANPKDAYDAIEAKKTEATTRPALYVPASASEGSNEESRNLKECTDR